MLSCWYYQPGLEYGTPSREKPEAIRGYLRGSVFSDADWASDETDRKSISGYCFFHANTLVSWSAVKQKTIALSSTEAEYYSMTHAIKEALWMRLFLSLHKFPLPKPFPLLCNNQSTCSLATNPALTPRSKHIHIHYLFIKEHITDGTFTTEWVSTIDMPADILTKPLAHTLFIKHCDTLGLVTV